MVSFDPTLLQILQIRYQENALKQVFICQHYQIDDRYSCSSALTLILKIHKSTTYRVS